MTSYQYRKSHCGDKTILRPSYLHNGISYTGKMTSLYWIRALVVYEELTEGKTHSDTRNNSPDETHGQSVLIHWGREKMAAIFLTTFWNAFCWMKMYDHISLTISLKCVRKVRINNMPSLVQIMAWRRPGDKPLIEPMMVSLLTYICVTRPQLGHV